MNRTSGIHSAPKVAGAALLATLMLVPCFANGAAFVFLDSNGVSGSATDNSFGDANSNLGVVVVNEAVDAWNVNIITGITKPIVGDNQRVNIDLGSVNLASSGTSAPLAIFFGDDSFNAAGTTHFRAAIGGTVQNADISWLTCIDASNTPSCASGTGPSGSFSGEGAFSDNDLFSAGLSGDYFIGMLVIITPSVGVPVLASFDYQVTQVPIPASAWLFVSSLLGLGALRRVKA